MKVSVNGKEEERVRAQAASHQAGPKTQKDVISFWFLFFFSKRGKRQIIFFLHFINWSFSSFSNCSSPLVFLCLSVVY